MFLKFYLIVLIIIILLFYICAQLYAHHKIVHPKEEKNRLEQVNSTNKILESIKDKLTDNDDDNLKNEAYLSSTNKILKEINYKLEKIEKYINEKEAHK